MSKQAETSVWKNALLFFSPHGFRLSRNQRYKGPIVSNGKITNGWADCGVFGDGGGDLVGYRIIEITPEMVGKKFARFAMFETKIMGGKKRKEQIQKIDMVNNDGGIAWFIKNEQDMKKVLDGELIV